MHFFSCYIYAQLVLQFNLVLGYAITIYLFVLENLLGCRKGYLYMVYNMATMYQNLRALTKKLKNKTKH